MFVPLLALTYLSPPDRVAYVAAVVETGVKRMENAAVVVLGDRIEAVVPAGEVPPGVKVVKLEGKTLYPGFIDAGGTKGVKDPAAPNEVGKPNASIAAPTSVWIGNRKGINPEHKASANLDFVPAQSDWENGFTAGLLMSNRGSLRGMGSIALYAAKVDSSKLIKADFGSGMSFRSGAGTGYPSNILGIIALMRQVLHDAKSMKDGAQLWDAETTKPTWASSLEALQPVLKGETPVFFDANLDREIERAIRLKDEFGFKLVLTGARDAYAMATNIKQSGASVVATVDFGSQPINNSSAPAAYNAERLERWKKQVTNAKTLADLGIEFSLTSGSSASSFWPNIRTMNLSASQVLQALTQTPAKLLGIQSQAGTLEAGKLANFIVASTDLLNPNMKIEQTFVAGERVFGPKEVTK